METERRRASVGIGTDPPVELREMVVQGSYESNTPRRDEMRRDKMRMKSVSILNTLKYKQTRTSLTPPQLVRKHTASRSDAIGQIPYYVHPFSAPLSSPDLFRIDSPQVVSKVDDTGEIEQGSESKPDKSRSIVDSWTSQQSKKC